MSLKDLPFSQAQKRINLKFSFKVSSKVSEKPINQQNAQIASKSSQRT